MDPVAEYWGDPSKGNWKDALILPWFNKRAVTSKLAVVGSVSFLRLLRWVILACMLSNVMMPVVFPNSGNSSIRICESSMEIESTFTEKGSCIKPAMGKG